MNKKIWMVAWVISLLITSTSLYSQERIGIPKNQFLKYSDTPVSNWTMIEDDIYGIIPNANIEAWEKNPPANISYNPNKELLKPSITWAKATLSIPGIGICPPNR